MNEVEKLLTNEIQLSESDETILPKQIQLKQSVTEQPPLKNENDIIRQSTADFNKNLTKMQQGSLQANQNKQPKPVENELSSEDKKKYKAEVDFINTQIGKQQEYEDFLKKSKTDKTRIFTEQKVQMQAADKIIENNITIIEGNTKSINQSEIDKLISQANTSIEQQAPETIDTKIKEGTIVATQSNIQAETAAITESVQTTTITIEELKKQLPNTTSEVPEAVAINTEISPILNQIDSLKSKAKTIIDNESSLRTTVETTSINRQTLESKRIELENQKKTPAVSEQTQISKEQVIEETPEAPAASETPEVIAPEAEKIEIKNLNYAVDKFNETRTALTKQIGEHNGSIFPVKDDATNIINSTITTVQTLLSAQETQSQTLSTEEKLINTSLEETQREMKALEATIKLKQQEKIETTTTKTKDESTIIVNLTKQKEAIDAKLEVIEEQKRKVITQIDAIKKQSSELTVYTNDLIGNAGKVPTIEGPNKLGTKKKPSPISINPSPTEIKSSFKFDKIKKPTKTDPGVAPNIENDEYKQLNTLNDVVLVAYKPSQVANDVNIKETVAVFDDNDEPLDLKGIEIKDVQAEIFKETNIENIENTRDIINNLRSTSGQYSPGGKSLFNFDKTCSVKEIIDILKNKKIDQAPDAIDLIYIVDNLLGRDQKYTFKNVGGYGKPEQTLTLKEATKYTFDSASDIFQAIGLNNKTYKDQEWNDFYNKCGVGKTKIDNCIKAKSEKDIIFIKQLFLKQHEILTNKNKEQLKIINSKLTVEEKIQVLKNHNISLQNPSDSELSQKFNQCVTQADLETINKKREDTKNNKIQQNKILLNKLTDEELNNLVENKGITAPDKAGQINALANNKITQNDIGAINLKRLEAQQNIKKLAIQKKNNEAFNTIKASGILEGSILTKSSDTNNFIETQINEINEKVIAHNTEIDNANKNKQSKFKQDTDAYKTAKNAYNKEREDYDKQIATLVQKEDFKKVASEVFKDDSSYKAVKDNNEKLKFFLVEKYKTMTPEEQKNFQKVDIEIKTKEQNELLKQQQQQKEKDNGIDKYNGLVDDANKKLDEQYKILKSKHTANSKLHEDFASLLEKGKQQQNEVRTKLESLEECGVASQTSYTSLLTQSNALKQASDAIANNIKTREATKPIITTITTDKNDSEEIKLLQEQLAIAKNREEEIIKLKTANEERQHNLLLNNAKALEKLLGHDFIKNNLNIEFDKDTGIVTTKDVNYAELQKNLQQIQIDLEAIKNANKDITAEGTYNIPENLQNKYEAGEIHSLIQCRNKLKLYEGKVDELGKIELPEPKKQEPDPKIPGSVPKKQKPDPDPDPDPEPKPDPEIDQVSALIPEIIPGSVPKIPLEPDPIQEPKSEKQEPDPKIPGSVPEIPQEPGAIPASKKQVKYNFDNSADAQNLLLIEDETNQNDNQLGADLTDGTYIEDPATEDPEIYSEADFVQKLQQSDLPLNDQRPTSKQEFYQQYGTKRKIPIKPPLRMFDPTTRKVLNINKATAEAANKCLDKLQASLGDDMTSEAMSKQIAFKMADSTGLYNDEANKPFRKFDEYGQEGMRKYIIALEDANRASIRDDGVAKRFAEQLNKDFEKYKQSQKDSNNNDKTEEQLKMEFAKIQLDKEWKALQESTSQIQANIEAHGHSLTQEEKEQFQAKALREIKAKQLSMQNTLNLSNEQIMVLEAERKQIQQQVQPQQQEVQPQQVQQQVEELTNRQPAQQTAQQQEVQPNSQKLEAKDSMQPQQIQQPVQPQNPVQPNSQKLEAKDSMQPQQAQPQNPAQPNSQKLEAQPQKPAQQPKQQKPQQQESQKMTEGGDSDVENEDIKDIERIQGLSYDQVMNSLKCIHVVGVALAAKVVSPLNQNKHNNAINGPQQANLAHTYMLQ